MNWTEHDYLLTFQMKMYEEAANDLMWSGRSLAMFIWCTSSGFVALIASIMT